MDTISSSDRSILEKGVIAARIAAETAAGQALDVLGVFRNERPGGLTDEQNRLRLSLRVKARSLGDGTESGGKRKLTEEVAYVQWHRMLFARVLADNNLLIHESGTKITLDDCFELAAEEGLPKWTTALAIVDRLFPGLFPTTNPEAHVAFSPDSVIALERILAGFRPGTFATADALGWVYQYWQKQRKDEINKSGRKIGADEIGPVTQLFTEHYMVAFLLENSLGAWWAGKHPESPLLRDMPYLRFNDDGSPAAGTFPDWPQTVAGVTVLDPCAGSGHFLVAAFNLLTKMRMEEEGLDARAAGDAVLRDNLFGLDIDARPLQIAVCALAIAAWKAGGYRPLPELNVACSGIPVKGDRAEWEALAKGDERLKNALGELQELFADAPTLGSLIDPVAVSRRGPLLQASFTEVAPLLEKALTRYAGTDPVAAVLAVEDAKSVTKVATILARRYALIATNVPFLTSRKFTGALLAHAHSVYPDSRVDLANMMLSRCLKLVGPDGESFDFTRAGSIAAILPSGWLYLKTSKGFRKRLLETDSLNVLVKIGQGAFQSAQAGGSTIALCIISGTAPSSDLHFAALDSTLLADPVAISNSLQHSELKSLHYLRQLDNIDHIITTESIDQSARLSSYALGVHGQGTFDDARFTKKFWEIASIGKGWVKQQNTGNGSYSYSGLTNVLLWEDGKGQLFDLISDMAKNGYSSGKWKAGKNVWGRTGIAVGGINDLHVNMYLGTSFTVNMSVIMPKEQQHMAAIWCYCKYGPFVRDLRRIDLSPKLTPHTMVKVPFDLDHWQKVAEERYPDGLPEPHSDDPTQWLFKGDIPSSTDPLQVAVARMLGYRWPEQLDDDPVLDVLIDTDGIVCLPAIQGEQAAEARLLNLLAAAYGDAWKPGTVQDLLSATKGRAGDLRQWLASGEFFAQHCKVFQNRPFIWQITDGARDGFAALVNYHKLDAKNLDRLIHTYLYQWIERQKTDAANQVAGADNRLARATALRDKLLLIQQGEAPYDIYTRWKRLDEQPIGWDPDINDGVRINCRPWVLADVFAGKFTIGWGKDSGANPANSGVLISAQAAQQTDMRPGADVIKRLKEPEMATSDGSERYNHIHLSLATKRAARAKAES